MTTQDDSPEILRQNDLWFGWLGGDDLSDIPSICFALPEIIPSFPWALLTRVDGGKSGTWLATMFASYVADEHPSLRYRVLADGTILLTGKDFYEMAEYGDLLGDFDEVWFFRDVPTAGPPEDRVFLTTTSITAEQEAHRTVVLTWAAQSGMVLGMGDGLGLNFVTSDVEIATRLSEICNIPLPEQ